jgi:starch synthase
LVWSRRLVQQKGIDLVLSAAESIVAAGGQVLVMGKGDQHFERALTHVSERFPGQVAVRIGFDEGTARRIFAGSDFILMPSRYEPCGLSQMYAQRFGALPIGRETGVSGDHSFFDGRRSNHSFEPLATRLAVKRNLTVCVRRRCSACLAGKRRPKTTY